MSSSRILGQFAFWSVVSFIIKYSNIGWLSNFIFFAFSWSWSGNLLPNQRVYLTQKKVIFLTASSIRIKKVESRCVYISNLCFCLGLFWENVSFYTKLANIGKSSFYPEWWPCWKISWLPFLTSFFSFNFWPAGLGGDDMEQDSQADDHLANPWNILASLQPAVYTHNYVLYIFQEMGRTETTSMSFKWHSTSDRGCICPPTASYLLDIEEFLRYHKLTSISSSWFQCMRYKHQLVLYTWTLTGQKDKLRFLSGHQRRPQQK